MYFYIYTYHVVYTYVVKLYFIYTMFFVKKTSNLCTSTFQPTLLYCFRTWCPSSLMLLVPWKSLERWRVKPSVATHDEFPSVFFAHGLAGTTMTYFSSTCREIASTRCSRSLCHGSCGRFALIFDRFRSELQECIGTSIY